MAVELNAFGCGVFLTNALQFGALAAIAVVAWIRIRPHARRGGTLIFAGSLFAALSMALIGLVDKGIGSALARSTNDDTDLAYFRLLDFLDIAGPLLQGLGLVVVVVGLVWVSRRLALN